MSIHPSTQNLLRGAYALLLAGVLSLTALSLLAEHAAFWFSALRLAGVLLALLGTAAGWLLTRRLLRQVGGDPEEISHVAELVAKGKLAIQFRNTGKTGGIYAAVQSMVHNLKTTHAERERQNWIKSGQTRLGECIGGDQVLLKLAENVINFLTPYVDAQVGAFYAVETDSGELRMLASHAYTWHGDVPTRYRVGEGMVGQAALERKPLVIHEPPEDYIRIDSGLGESPPSAVLVAPFLYEGELKGVVELATLHQFTPTHLEFLQQIAPALAIAVNTAESRTQMKELLARTQAQAGELEKQTRVLQAQRAEMQHSNEELQAQSEELQTQQEELRQTNESLELRTLDLERRQEEIRLKNAALQKSQAEIQIKAEELALASKYKSEFLANMSHELRTPLNSLLILAQLLATNKDGNLNEKEVECARTIHSSGSDLLNLINEILDLSKVEAGKVELRGEDVGLSQLVESLEKKFRHVAEEKGLAFDIQVAEGVPETLYSDPQRLKQIVNNLLSNAFKFTHQGRVELRILRPPADADLRRSGLHPAHGVLLQVSDSGIGIPEDKQKVIFEAFQQADGTTSRKYGGTGLGLSISRQLVQLMGGEIQLRSAPEQGSTFSVYLPERIGQPAAVPAPPAADTPPPAPSVAAAEPASPPAAEKPAAPSPQDDRDAIGGDDKVMLIVEDDATFAKIVIDLAREKGFKCLYAADGREGLRLAEERRPQAIILDVGLPQIDGWTVMDRLKSNEATRHIPVHFISGHEHGMEARRRGAIGYSLKPVNMQELAEAFRHIERTVSGELRKPLLVARPERRQALQDLLAGPQVELTLCATRAEAEQCLRDPGREFDCIVVDADVEEGQGAAFLEKLYHDERAARLPVILYAERELRDPEKAVLQRCEAHLAVRTAQTPERLLDETTLFLHQVTAKLPEEKRNMLRMIHDKEAILGGKKILLVDDDVRNTFALATALENKQMEVLIGKNGKHGLQVLEQNPGIDLVLMDIMMPEMDGYEATRRIRAQPRFQKLPIIALTAKAMKGDKAKCIEAGASDYLAKPVDMDRLLSLLRVWLYP